jgi:HK97 family phage major capsid protein
MLPKELQAALDGLKKDAIDKVTAVETKATSMQAAIDAITVRYDAEIAKVNEAMKKSNISLPGVNDGKEKFSFTKAFRGIVLGDWRDSGYEQKVMQEAAALVEKTGNYASAGVAGGFFIPVEVSDMVIPLAFAKMPLLKEAGATLLQNLTSNLTIPRITARGVAYWVGENAVPTNPANAQFGTINLTPKRLAAYTKVSNLLLLQAPAVAEKVILEELARSLALAWHLAMLYGTGTSFQPKGIINSGIQATTAIGASGGRATLDVLQQMQATIDNSDLLLDSGKFIYVAHPIVKQYLKRERVQVITGTASNVGLPIYGMFQGNMADTDLEDRIGYPIKSTTQIHTNNAKGSSTTLSDVIFGDLTNLIVATWAGMVLKKTDVASDANSSAFLQDETWLLVQQQTDFAIKNELSWTKISDAETLQSKI